MSVRHTCVGIVVLLACGRLALAAEEAAKTNEVAQNFWSLVDPESVSVQRFTLL